MTRPSRGAVGRAYRACPIKRARRTKADIDEIKTAIKAVLKADHPMTVRQVFYALTVRWGEARRGLGRV